MFCGLFLLKVYVNLYTWVIMHRFNFRMRLFRIEPFLWSHRHPEENRIIWTSSDARTLILLWAAGGAAAVGGITLTSATLGIKCVLCRHIASRPSSDGSLDFWQRVQVAFVQQSGADGGAPGWGAAVARRSQRPCPVTVMGADGSKNRKASTVFFDLFILIVWHAAWGALTRQSCNSRTTDPFSALQVVVPRTTLILIPLDPVTKDICELNALHHKHRCLKPNALVIWHTFASK